MIRRILAGCLSAALFLTPAAGCEDPKTQPKLEGAAADIKPQAQSATGKGGTSAAGAAANFR